MLIFNSIKKNLQKFLLKSSKLSITFILVSTMAESISPSTTSKGKTCVMDTNNYCYHLNNYKEGYQHKSWLCSVKGCNARIKTTIDFKLVGKILDGHKHLNNMVLKRAATTMENTVIKWMAVKQLMLLVILSWL